MKHQDYKLLESLLIELELSERERVDNNQNGARYREFVENEVMLPIQRVSQLANERAKQTERAPERKEESSQAELSIKLTVAEITVLYFALGVLFSYGKDHLTNKMLMSIVSLSKQIVNKFNDAVDWKGGEHAKE